MLLDLFIIKSQCMAFQ